MTRNFGEANGFWKGGRSIASNGYVLIRVGTEHHLADVRGYCYEHRLVAEKTLGRRLEPGEEVHHKDLNKTNNHPDNLEVCSSRAEHFMEHRSESCRNRKPDELNELVICACGCGTHFMKFDHCGRPRKWAPGHNATAGAAMVRRRILDALIGRELHTNEVASLTNSTVVAVDKMLYKLRLAGLIVRTGPGKWSLPESRNG